MNWQAFWAALVAIPIFVWIAPHAFMAGVKTAVWWLRPEQAHVRRIAEWIAAILLTVLTALIIGVIAA